MVTITEDYVSFETAELLKEKGFNEECFALYNPDGVLIQSGIRLNNIQVGRVKGSYSAPTLQMTMKWLRVVHKIDVWVEGWNRRYKGHIHSEQRGVEALFYEDSYEVACEEAIKHCLENLI